VKAADKSYPFPVAKMHLLSPLLRQFEIRSATENAAHFLGKLNSKSDLSPKMLHISYVTESAEYRPVRYFNKVKADPLSPASSSTTAQHTMTVFLFFSFF
jgi:hypothetical protein